MAIQPSKATMVLYIYGFDPVFSISTPLCLFYFDTKHCLFTFKVSAMKRSLADFPCSFHFIKYSFQTWRCRHQGLSSKWYMRRSNESRKLYGDISLLLYVMDHCAFVEVLIEYVKGIMFDFRQLSTVGLCQNLSFYTLNYSDANLVFLIWWRDKEAIWRLGWNQPKQTSKRSNKQ